jgi:ribosome biogenesis GTPase A
MKNFWEIVNKVIEDADILLLILDARLVRETRNREIEDKVRGAGKPLIYVITKCDLVTKREAEAWKKKLRPSVFMSAKERLGTSKLRERILIEAQKAKLKWRVLRIGVLGYPNVGKSSVINVLKGKKSAPTSSLSGYTKGVRNVKIGPRIMLIDTPGVIPYMERNPVKHLLIGTTDFTKSKDPDLDAMELMRRFPGKIESFYGIGASGDSEKSLIRIAIKKNMITKGGRPDIMRAARVILRDWQRGMKKPVRRKSG